MQQQGLLKPDVEEVAQVQDEDHDDDGHDAGDVDVPDATQAGGPIHNGGFMQSRVDRGQGREVHNRGEAHVLPDIRPHKNRLIPVRIA